jgi:hypothetical protein
MADLCKCIRTGIAFVAAASFCGVATAGGSGFDPSDPEDLGNALPVSVAGNSCGAGDFGILNCQGFTPAGGEDYWYLWTSPVDGNVIIDVCDAEFDSVIEAFDANTFIPIACNDDACGDLGFRSQMQVSVTNGQSIIIGVDSYGETTTIPFSCGDFTLNIGLPDPCPDTTCPAGGILEDEPCRDLLTEEDVTNGGCNFASMIFGSVARGDVICGNVWTTETPTGSTRDLDWFVYDHPGGSLDVTMAADMPAIVFVTSADISGSDVQCFDTIVTIAAVDTGPFCGVAEINIANLDCDEYIIIAASQQFFFGFDCGDAAYVLEVDGAGVCLPPCPWDFNNSGAVDSADLLELLNNWGPCPGL